jgi:CheY-like chemotaxis protein
MDDDDMVRQVASRMLERLGYAVVTARDGAEAIELYHDARKAGNPFHLAIMDLTIPGGMGGKEAIRQLREIAPEIKAIVSSGYFNDPVMASFREHGFDGVIAKPYQLENLRDALKAVLGSH